MRTGTPFSSKLSVPFCLQQWWLVITLVLVAISQCRKTVIHILDFWCQRHLCIKIFLADVAEEMVNKLPQLFRLNGGSILLTCHYVSYMLAHSIWPAQWTIKVKVYSVFGDTYLSFQALYLGQSRALAVRCFCANISTLFRQWLICLLQGLDDLFHVIMILITSVINCYLLHHSQANQAIL